MKNLKSTILHMSSICKTINCFVFSIVYQWISGTYIIQDNEVAGRITKETIIIFTNAIFPLFLSSWWQSTSSLINCSSIEDNFKAVYNLLDHVPNLMHDCITSPFHWLDPGNSSLCPFCHLYKKYLNTGYVIVCWCCDKPKKKILINLRT